MCLDLFEYQWVSYFVIFFLLYNFFSFLSFSFSLSVRVVKFVFSPHFYFSSSLEAIDPIPILLQVPIWFVIHFSYIFFFTQLENVSFSHGRKILQNTLIILCYSTSHLFLGGTSCLDA